MPVGVEGFVAGRLKMARCARALRQKELADRIERAVSTVSRWESVEYEHSPEPSILAKLAEILGVQVNWFFKPLPEKDSVSFFRSLKSEHGILREKASARLGFVREIEDILSQMVDFPDVDIPDFAEGLDFREIRRADIERIAADLRQHWGIGDDPIDDLLLLIENSGVIVGEDYVGSEKLDGVSQWSKISGRPYMLLAKDKSVGVRRRFDAAHELGHIILHRNVSIEELYQNFQRIEEQAMDFAGAILLPESSFCDDIYSFSLDGLLAIKKKWKVSVAAMIKRMSAIDKISPEYERRMWQYYSRRKWRGFEPYDDEIPIESPMNLKSAIEIIVDDGLADRSDLVRQVAISPEDISDLTGLPKEYFSPPQAKIISVTPKAKNSERNADGNDAAEVIELASRRRR